MKAVVNLAPHSKESRALPDEKGLVQSLGMEYHHIPVEWTRPLKENFVAFVRTMEALGEQKVLVHCAANYRVSAFYSLYAMKHKGWSAEQAAQLRARIWESRPEYRMDDTWKALIDEIERSQGPF